MAGQDHFNTLLQTPSRRWPTKFVQWPNALPYNDHALVFHLHPTTVSICQSPDVPSAASVDVAARKPLRNPRRKRTGEAPKEEESGNSKKFRVLN